MAFQYNAVAQVLEGIVGSSGSSKLGYPQAMTPWLRAMKECINFNGRFIEDDHVIDVFTDVDEVEQTIQGAATYLYGVMAKSTDDAAQVVQLWDVATPTPGTTQTGQHGTIQLALGAATTPVVGGVVWFPYEYFGTTCLISSTDHADYATAPATDTVTTWSVRRNQ